MIQLGGKKQKGSFLGMLLATLDASLLGHILASKEVVRSGDRVIRADEVTNRANHDF